MRIMQTIFLGFLIFLTGTISHAQSEGIIKGKVLETMNGGGYTYVYLENAGTKFWVATSQMPVEVGQEISLLPGMVMKNFESKTLNRTFEEIIFSSGPASGTTGTSEHGHEHGSGMAPSNTNSIPAGDDPIAALSRGAWKQKTVPEKTADSGKPIKVEKAKGENAYTIEEIFAQSKSLNNKSVVVRGKVVKALTQIMGKNWLHLQDGTGSDQKKTHDLVITTKDMPEVGQIVTLMGTLYINKDFGSGYAYDVIIEEASVLTD